MNSLDVSQGEARQLGGEAGTARLERGRGRSRRRGKEGQAPVTAYPPGGCTALGRPVLMEGL